MIVSLPSRSELLTWISQLTNKNVERLQHLSDGLQFCEVFEKIYPGYINHQKLKRDAKVSLEKEKNFRMLLNAINNIGLCLNINIADLSQGKITAILELLQWFYKQYKNPMDRSAQSAQKFNEPRMIKSYVGNLMTRQKSCIKVNELPETHFVASRRSLDSKLLQISFKSEDSKSVKSKSIKLPSQNKKKVESKPKTSKVKSVSINQAVFEEKCKEKKESLKKMLSDKKEKKNEPMTQRSIKEVLEKTLMFEKPRLQRTLIKVTEAALENNPQLQAKIKMLLESGSEKKEKRECKNDLNLSPDAQVKNLLNSYINTEKCQKDMNQKLELEDTEIMFSSHDENLENKNQNVESPNPFRKPEEKRQTHDILKKSFSKTDSKKGNNSILMSQHMIKQISAQKEKNQRELSGLQREDQNKQHSRIFTNLPQVSNIFNPHYKVANPETHVTEKKIEARQEFENSGNVREVQSEKLNRQVDNMWKSHQKLGPQNDFQ